MMPLTLQAIGSSVFVTDPLSGIALEFARLVDHKDTLTAEVTITSLGAGEIAWSRVNLTSVQGRNALSKAANEKSPEAPWPDVVNDACRMVARHLRAGTPAMPLVATQPSGTRFLVPGYLPLGQISILYADGGCIGADTVLDTPDGALRVADAVGVRRVWSLTPRGPVPAWARVFAKGADLLYRIALDDGTQIVVTAGHRFLTSSGWKDAGACAVGERLAGDGPGRPRTSVDIVPEGHRRDAPHSWGTGPDWRGHCWRGCRPGDGPLPVDRVVDPSSVPLRVDVLAHIRPQSDRDAPEHARGYIRAYRPTARPPRRHFASVEHWPTISEFRGVAWRSIPRHENTRGCAPFPPSWQSWPEHESRQSEVASAAGLVAYPGVYYRTITAIRKLGFGPYYDLQVPIHQNYLAEGLWHHNSGKSLLALAIAVSGLLGHPLSARWAVGAITRALYLDWESDQASHAERLWGLTSQREAVPDGALLYRRLWRPLTDHLDTIRADCDRHHVDFVVVDSLAPASGPEPESGDAAVRTLSALGALLPATVLVVAHVSKQGQDATGRTRIYGSVFNTNLARSTIEAKLSELSDDHRLVVNLRHDKHNLGPKVRPSALALEWDDEGHIAVSGAEPDASTFSLPAQILNALKGGQQTAQALAEITQRSEEQIRARLHSLQTAHKVVRLSDFSGGKGKKNVWGLADTNRTPDS